MNRHIAALGAAQCLLWGTLYYTFGVVLDPLARSLDIERAVAVGAFSLGVALSGAVAPLAARVFTAGHALPAMRGAAIVAAIAMLAWACVTSTVALYAAWAVLGLCMAFVLYEAAYAVVVDVASPDTQRDAWTVVTLWGALASPWAVPAMHAIARDHGWRAALLAGAAVIAVAVAFLLTIKTPRHIVVARPATHRLALRGAARAAIYLPAIGTAAAATLGVLLLVDLLDRGVDPVVAALVPALIGLAQVPGRLLVSRRFDFNLKALTIAAVTLQAIGLVALVVYEHPAWLAVSAIAFGMGAGLNTLLKPLWFAAVAPRADVHALNARTAVMQNGARATAPLAAACIAYVATPGLGYIGIVFAMLLVACGCFVVRAIREANEPPAHSLR